jgi:SWI/SNF-related matrix-associated actin-dependent regulator 1 of chromatin subfamily A
VIPDTPGSPPVQVIASSPIPIQNGVSTNANTFYARVSNGQNATVAAVAEAMKLANPQFTSPAKSASIRRPGFPSQSPAPQQTIIPQSPPEKIQFNQYVSQFSFNPALHPSAAAPIPQHSTYRITPNATVASAYGTPNRPRPIQARPIQPPAYGGGSPQLDYRPVEGTPLRRLVDMFPHISELQGINALTMCRGIFEDAAARIVEDPSFGTKPIPPAPQPTQPRPQQHAPQNYGSIPPVPIQSTTKRTLKAPLQTIQQKYTHLNQNSVPNTFPYNLAARQLMPIAPFQGPPTALTQFSVSPSRPTQSKKRKLVRGGGKHLDSDGDSMSSEEDEEEPTNRDEQFEEKVLSFLNTASPEEISDISFTPLDQITVFLSNRPFGSLEHSRAIELPPDDETERKEKKGRGGKRSVKKGRNIGNRIVDGVEEVLEGYSGVDDLISECETIGKRVREKLSKWTSSAKDVVEEGALTLSSLNPSTPSTMTTDPSPAPPDGNGGDPDFMAGQPVSLAENVSLKDYQLIGVNWLHLLYKEGLSCILADEMGLGKTCQVIAFLGGLLERTGGQRGKHLVVVPSSTIGIPLFVAG